MPYNQCGLAAHYVRWTPGFASRPSHGRYISLGVVLRKTILFLVFLSLPMLASADGEFQFIFGILKDGEQGVELVRETRTIPFITKQEGQIFGAIVIPPSSESYSLQYKLVLPANPSVTSGAGELDRSTREYSSPIYESTDSSASLIWLDDGDPAGEYQIHYYVNGSLIETITFSVEEKI